MVRYVLSGFCASRCFDLRPPNGVITTMHAIIINARGTAAHNLQKWKITFLTSPCHEIYREEAVCLGSSNYIL